MTIEECYTNMGADYGDVLRRLGNEDRVKRFLGKIPEDTSFSLLCEAYEKGDGREAFRAAHSLKGICMNLGLTVLYTSSACLLYTSRVQTRRRNWSGRQVDGKGPILRNVVRGRENGIICAVES